LCAPLSSDVCCDTEPNGYQHGLTEELAVNNSMSADTDAADILLSEEIVTDEHLLSLPGMMPVYFVRYGDYFITVTLDTLYHFVSFNCH